MYFKKLELVGFKSFCNKTTLNFEPGITAVVGPNGTGKSNLLDSIRWVLGEQSAKSLRGSEMQDVIFNGTDSKEPISMAEVSLTFDNTKRFFNVEHPEIMVTRRIFRSGESEYLLNKTIVRLKDILDLLSGTGIGAESYSIVAQGKIDLVLSSKPEDRRVIFDEASGITKYKAQKRETMRRLEETEQNLLRVSDIVLEVKRQIASLERQAAKARRYKEVFEELKQKEINLSVLQKKGILKQKNEAIQQINELELREKELLNIISELDLKNANQKAQLKDLENNMMEIRNQILNLENLAVRNNEHIKFNKEKIQELEENKKHLEQQATQVKNRLLLDKEKLDNVKLEYAGIKKNIEEKSSLLVEKEALLNSLACAIKNSLEAIVLVKKSILELVNKLANTKNELSDFSAKKQIFLARKKRLEIEKAKVFEEKAYCKRDLDAYCLEVASIKQDIGALNGNISQVENEIQIYNHSIEGINAQILESDKERLTLESHKEFLDKLKTAYEGINESMNAVIYLDKLPQEFISGLVIKIKERANLSDAERQVLNSANFKLQGEAKPVELDTQKIDEKLAKLQESLTNLRKQKEEKELNLAGLNKSLSGLKQELRALELSLANKETTRATVEEQFNKIEEEEDVVVMELEDSQREISVLEKNIEVLGQQLTELNNEHKVMEDSIMSEEGKISSTSKLREEALVIITQIKTELANLSKRLVSDEATFKIVEDAYRQDLDSLANIENQIKDAANKRSLIDLEINDAQKKIMEFNQRMQQESLLLQEAQGQYNKVQEGAGDMITRMVSHRKELDTFKNKLYELQMHNKDLDYKYSSIRERMLQAYKLDLEAIKEAGEEFDADTLKATIQKMKEKLDAYGTVNLVAIEEYDELKKRYDFLMQQQNDLLTAKESLREAILKINRTTKQMFLETFEKVREEFRGYFKLLFNGGDAQLFLIDEQDPLESGIEIICRPPGKKLQNVLLLSGGEKSMSAIALIFAIFKVKPSPFCILDEIDAALDEANVDRFSQMLQDFTKQSQFIVITHNKKTITKADVMYGITMEESGVSKIVSVKFAKDPAVKDKEPDMAVA
jgi:chromosome segregation protein